MEVPPAESCVCPAKHYIENWKPISEPLDATPISVNLPVCRLSTCTAVLISATAAACYLSSAFHTGYERKTNLKRLLLGFFRGCLYSSYLGFQKKKNNFFFFHKENIQVCISSVVFVEEKEKNICRRGKFRWL